MKPRFFVPFLVFGLVSGQSLQDDLTQFKIPSIFPQDVAYANASEAFNLRYNLTPSVITYPTTIQQVSEIVKLGGLYTMSVTARSGGHSYIAAALSTSIVIDLSSFNSITYSPKTKRAKIESGNRIGDVALNLNEWGRGVPHGSCPYVGMGGHSAFGGFGFPSRMWGLAMDAVEEIEGVLGNGSIVTSSAERNPALFWAQKGSAPSFSIITSSTYRTHSAPKENVVYQIGWSVTADEASEMITLFQQFALSTNPVLPRTFGGELNLYRGTEQGRVAISLFCAMFNSTSMNFNTTIEPFLSSLPKGVIQTSQPRLVEGTWLDALEAISGDLDTGDVSGQGRDTFYVKSLVTPEGDPLAKETVGNWTHWLAEEGFKSNLSWFTQVELYGGPASAINSVPLDASSFRRRDSLFTIQMYASSQGNRPPYPDEEGFGFLDGLAGSLGDNEGLTAYRNYPDDRLANWQDMYYGPVNYPRLQEIKREVDPGNVFRFPLSVEL